MRHMEKSAGALPQLCLAALGPVLWNGSRLFEMRLHIAPPVFKRPGEPDRENRYFWVGQGSSQHLIPFFSLVLFLSLSFHFLFTQLQSVELIKLF